MKNWEERVVGITNVNSFCFMNSIFQCLYVITEFIKYFIKGKFEEDLNYNEPNNEKFVELANGISKFYIKYIEKGKNIEEIHSISPNEIIEEKHSLSPDEIKENISSIESEYDGTRQQDAMLFLLFLLNSLHEGLKEKVNNRNNQNFRDRNDNNIQRKRPLLELFQKALEQTEVSKIYDLFSFKDLNATHCLLCNHYSHNWGHQLFLPLSIPKDANNIYECLDDFFKYEKNYSTCNNCKSYKSSERQLVFASLPKILIIQLKRIEFDSETSKPSKIDKKIEFPLKNLDLSKYTYHFYNGQSYKYDLIAVTNHYGFSTEHGHYKAYTKIGGQCWFEFNDDTYREIDESSIVKFNHIIKK
ncbi:cysteine proteinase [Neocallimastix lanati (nom. inval.)]|uniref:Cysteine proteinase n=1 Tax=Neocallimastix californiae TaxID=1754190 RepID=A0A1Y2ED06_9FUNG|nr:cysteine proteinase [Neocallimastix sp. JGI-2020a]ORY69194.1 cysteine proteinase [Neocallimastix californiae]|eukprot:ORY69194.1 cysteine proteinase [Neocallimastix californiae]